MYMILVSQFNKLKSNSLHRLYLPIHYKFQIGAFITFIRLMLCNKFVVTSTPTGFANS